MQRMVLMLYLYKIVLLTFNSKKKYFSNKRKSLVLYATVISKCILFSIAINSSFVRFNLNAF